MLAKESIEALLKIDTQNPNDNRLLRIMSCNNPIKDLYVFHLGDIKEEFNQDVRSFEGQIALCIYKFDMDIYNYLNNDGEDIHTRHCAVKLSKKIITDAINELLNFYALLVKAILNDIPNCALINDIYSFKMPNYIAILQLCGLVDISEDIYRSKILDRFHNIKDQAYSYKNERIAQKVLLEEFKSHIEFFASQLDIIKKNNMYDEDFLVYVIMFDIRHYKHNRNQSRTFRKENLK